MERPLFLFFSFFDSTKSWGGINPSGQHGNSLASRAILLKYFKATRIESCRVFTNRNIKPRISLASIDAYKQNACATMNPALCVIWCNLNPNYSYISYMRPTHIMYQIGTWEKWNNVIGNSSKVSRALEASRHAWDFESSVHKYIFLTFLVSGFRC